MSALTAILAGWNGKLSARERSNRAEKPAFITENAQSAFDFVNSIGVNTHLNYFDTVYGNFPFVERELKSIGILHVRDGVLPP